MAFGVLQGDMNLVWSYFVIISMVVFLIFIQDPYFDTKNVNDNSWPYRNLDSKTKKQNMKNREIP